MKGYLIALALAAMPALGNFAGGMLAEVLRPSERLLSYALHAAAGIIIAVVAVELLPASFEAVAGWVVVTGFVVGGACFIAIDALIERMAGTGRQGIASESAKPASGPWVIYFGVCVDLFSDGLMIGAGSTVGFMLGLLLALGQVPADVPEGFATMANFRAKGLARRKRLLLSASFAIPLFLGVTVGYWAVRDAPEVFKFALLSFTAGMLVTVAVEEIVPEAHKSQEKRTATACFIGGFALFALISSYLG